jgi:hypothetical protein
MIESAKDSGHNREERALRRSGPSARKRSTHLLTVLQHTPKALATAAPACAFLNHTPDHLGSTMGRGSGILMNVHSAPFPEVDISQHQSPRSGPNGQPFERPRLE